jgi:Protein of unknown function (DUF1236)
MRRTLLAVAALATMAGVTPSYAQGVVIDLEPEQRTVIREYVVRQRPPVVRLPGEVRIGAVLPADVEVRAVPDNWGPEVRRYRYVYWNDRVVFVEPGSRRVIHIVD